jgi:predicted MFS family arabinose efflux permease
MLPLNVFANRNFAGANLMTAFFYGGLQMGSLSIVLYIQEVAGYSATAAGLATLPSPIISFLFAKRVGGSAARLGPRLFLITGPLLAGIGYLLIRPDAHGFDVITDLLPGVIVFATGTVLTSTPLTALNLSSVEPEHGGIAAAIQNAVGRLSALIATACVGLIAANTLTDASFGRLLRVAGVVLHRRSRRRRHHHQPSCSCRARPLPSRRAMPRPSRRPSPTDHAF